jgi:hypothetical protein
MTGMRIRLTTKMTKLYQPDDAEYSDDDFDVNDGSYADDYDDDAMMSMTKLMPMMAVPSMTLAMMRPIPRPILSLTWKTQRRSQK